MTLNGAIQKAKKIAKKRQETMFVVYEDEFEGYQVATDIDCDTFFCGCDPVAAVLTDGTVER